MDRDQEIEGRFWKALQSDMTLMIGLAGTEEARMMPMTAQVEEPRGPLWIFTATDNSIVETLRGGSGKGVAAYAAKGHEVFAQLHGTLRVDNDRAAIDRLWNRFVAAWYEGGKDDPKLALLRFDAAHAEIWLNESSVFAGIRLLLGADPKQDYKDKVAEVRLR